MRFITVVTCLAFIILGITSSGCIPKDAKTEEGVIVSKELGSYITHGPTTVAQKVITKTYKIKLQSEQMIEYKDNGNDIRTEDMLIGSKVKLNLCKNRRGAYDLCWTFFGPALPIPIHN